MIPVVCLSAVSDTRCLLATSAVMLHRTLPLTVDGRRSDPYIHGDLRAWVKFSSINPVEKFSRLVFLQNTNFT